MKSLKLAAIFSDHCVLQRGKPITVFGTGSEGIAVEAEVFGKVLGTGEEQRAIGRATVRDGRFEIRLPALREGLDHTLVVRGGGEVLSRTDVAIGEVWLAGGQSNMELELGDCAESDALRGHDNERIRFYYTQKRAVMDEEFFRQETNSAWECFGYPGTSHWSAVGYFFAEKLQGKLGVPVGIIGCNWGGTSASAWMPRTALEEDRDLAAGYLAPYDKAVAGKSEAQQFREYEEYAAYQAEFDKKCAELYRKQPGIEWDEVQRIIGESRYPGPMCCCNPFRPGGLYECMLKRVMPYSLKGFLYYQGESDDHLPRLYFKIFSRLIQQWRDDWGDDGLPFLFVQLPMHRYKQDPDFKNWCLIREAQDRVRKTVRNTGMACAIDQGEFNEIHPKHKRVVGERLYFQALEVAYGIPCPEGRTPEFSWAETYEDALILHFENVAGNLHPSETGEETSEATDEETAEMARQAHGHEQGQAQTARNRGMPFEIAGEDGGFVPADEWESIGSGNDSAIRIKSEKVPNPRYARYLWTNYTDRGFLYADNGMPLPPFRTAQNLPK